MQYHIQTAPIWDSFRQKCDCPICSLYSVSESRLVKQYLGEAVMQPDYRVKVNSRGFCSKHLLALYRGDNKLGVALQTLTRTETVDNDIGDIKTAKQAKQLAKRLAETLDTCVICDTVDEMIARKDTDTSYMLEKGRVVLGNVALSERELFKLSIEFLEKEGQTPDESCLVKLAHHWGGRC